MKLRSKIFIFFLLISVCTLIYFHNKFSYAKENPQTFTINHQKSNVLKIGIIGDSWVVRKPLGEMLQAKLKEKGIAADIISSGNPGATTRQIYENIFKNADEVYSSKFIIESQPDYCIVISGVNDAATHVGVDFYAHHLLMITKLLRENNIQPIIVTLPSVGLEENLETKNILTQSANKIFELAISGGKIYQISDYQQKFAETLKHEGLDKEVWIFDFNKVLPDFIKDRNYYADPMHLNNSGYRLFVEKLAADIKENIKK